ncbi:MAG TPA: response regulator, partial [Candidatus Methylomirabilis sp.]|nr:response regulator [Candidatus Methylomirabilis sp.]
VKQSDGYISVESRPGEGTVFRICFPRCEEFPVDRAEDARAAYTRGKGETILLVEDDETVRTLLRTTLTEGGYALLEADDGEEAVTLLRRDDRLIHLLITDVIMPKMGGKELSDRLAVDRPGMKILFVSGYVDNEILRKQRFDRGEEYLQKPFTPETLLRTVRKMLEPEPGRER